MSTKFSFEAIGTHWNITVDDRELRETERNAILSYIADFDKRFSRFRPESEANRFREASAGTYEISPEFARLLERAHELRRLTAGRFDPAVAKLLETAGYDATYSLRPKKEVTSFVLPEWSLSGTSLRINGPVAFDLGGIGKGYCIDRVTELLRGFDLRYFLVEAGGDAFGTTKETGEPWRVALEYPGRPGVAAGLVNLANDAVAVSDTFRRRWKDWSHIVDAKSGSSVTRVIGAIAIAPNAWGADCMTSALFFSDETAYPRTARIYEAEYLTFKEDGRCLRSANWSGELFDDTRHRPRP